MTHHHFIDVLASQAIERPGQSAVLFLGDGREVSASATFDTLYQRATSLAAKLQRYCAPGGRVLLMLPSSMDYVDAFCACQCADVVAVPLFAPQSRRPRHLDRVRNVVADARPDLILTTHAAKPVLRELADALAIGARILTISELDAEPDHTWERPQFDPEAIAFLQYTSGSTGTPKGVVVRQRNLLANLELMRASAGFADHGCMVNWLPLYHDMGLIGGLLAPIYIGMRCVLMETRCFVQSPSVWLQAISRYRGSASFAPNSAYELCTTAVDDATIAQLDLSCWKQAICGAEPVHAATMAAFAVRFAPAGLTAQAMTPGYGQAEATLCVCTVPATETPWTLRVDRAALHQGRVVPVGEDGDAVEFVGCGYPQPRHGIAIVDPATLVHCEPGVVGEIWLHGPSNADAYWQQPAISEQTFRARAVGDERHYLRSGDLGFMHRGQLVICGRLKDLIILNGRNLYPNDIEFAITQAESGIRAGRIAAFSVTDLTQGREQLIVVAEPHRRCAGGAAQQSLFATVREAVREAADCAVDVIVLIAAATIPMTTSGKISRSGARRQYLDKTLEVIAISGAEGARPAVQPLPDLPALRAGGATRAHLAAACAAWLGQQIGALRPGVAPCPQASLIALGLDSLAIAALHGRVKAQTGWHAPFEQLFGVGTLAMLGEGLRDHLETGRGPDAAIAVLPVQAARRLSHAQRRLWFLNRLDPRSCEHNIAVCISLHGALDRAALERALADLTLRHPVLRTAYRDGHEHPLQQLSQCPTAHAAWVDLGDADCAHSTARLAEVVELERSTPFDLSAGEVLRSTLVRLAPDRHALILGVHHIAFDGRSAEIVLSDLDRLYAAHSGASAADMGPAPLGYADFAEWEARRMDSGLVEGGLHFWRGFLQDMPHALALPRLPGNTAGGGQHGAQLSAAAVARLEQTCRAHGSTVFMGLLTLFAACLHHLSGQERFIVGTDVAGRSHPQLDDVVGFFVNQLPLRCDLTGDPSLAKLLARLAADAQLAYAHQELPFDLLVSALAPERRAAQAPLFQVKLNWQPDRAHCDAIGPLRVDAISHHQAGGAFDLVVDLTHSAHGVNASVKYRQACFDQHAIERLLQLWCGLIDDHQALLAQPLSALSAHLRRRDNALRLALQQQQTAAGRALLGVSRRRLAQA